MIKFAQLIVYALFISGYTAAKFMTQSNVNKDNSRIYPPCFEWAEPQRFVANVNWKHYETSQ